MKYSIQFWCANAIVICCLAIITPAQAQVIKFSTNGFLSIDQGTNTSINLWNVTNPTDLLIPKCPAYRRQTASQFIITGRGGLPPNPREALRNDREMMFTVQAAAIAPNVPWLTTANCHTPSG